MSDDNPWDDAAFKTRVKAAAAKKGITLRDALLAAGVSRGHLDKIGDGRMTDTILRLAKVLDVSPIYLFGLDEEVERRIRSDLTYWRSIFKEARERTTVKEKHNASASKTDKPYDRDKRISLYTKIISAQLAAQFATLICMASDNSDEDGAALMEFVLRVIDQVSNDDRGGKTPAM